MTRMRELLVDLRTVDHRVQDVGSAIGALAEPLRDRGVDVRVAVTLDRALPVDAALLVHRAAREILLELRRVPGVAVVLVALEDDGRDVTLTVEHDARAPEDDPRLAVLAESVATRGGRLRVAPTEGGDERITVSLPAG